MYDFLSGVKVTSDTKFIALDNPSELRQNISARLKICLVNYIANRGNFILLMTTTTKISKSLEIIENLLQLRQCVSLEIIL